MPAAAAAAAARGGEDVGSGKRPLLPLASHASGAFRPARSLFGAPPLSVGAAPAGSTAAAAAAAAAAGGGAGASISRSTPPSQQSSPIIGGTTLASLTPATPSPTPGPSVPQSAPRPGGAAGAPQARSTAKERMAAAAGKSRTLPVRRNSNKMHKVCTHARRRFSLLALGFVGPAVHACGASSLHAHSRMRGMDAGVGACVCVHDACIHMCVCVCTGSPAIEAVHAAAARRRGVLRVVQGAV
jgi:hypothetical protein